MDKVEVKDHAFVIHRFENGRVMCRCTKCAMTVVMETKPEESLQESLKKLPGCPSIVASIDEEKVKKLREKGGCRSCGKR